MTFAGIEAYHDASGLASRARALSKARRHTIVVRSLRLLLPLSAVALTAAIIAPLLSDPVSSLPEIDVGSIGLSSTAITMQRPRLTGFSQDRRAYEVSADRAEQNLATPDQLGLFAITSRMEMRENGWANLVARHGLLDSKTELLDLDEAIQVETDLGDSARLTRARIAFVTGEIVSDAPVDITTDRMNLKADRMHVTDSGNLAVFTGQVVMMLYPEPDEPAGAPSEPTP